MTGGRELDKNLLRTYLSDHVAAAAAVTRRLSRMAAAYPDTPLARPMADLAQVIDSERDWLIDLARNQQIPLSRWKSAATSVAEQVGRLKLNGRTVRTSPLSPMLELELLMTGLRGKRSAWLTLHEWATELGTDRAKLDELLSHVENQIETVEQLATQVRTQAFSQT